MKDEDFYKMVSGMMEAREKERMLGIRVLIIAHNAYKFQGCAQIYRNYLPQHIAIHSASICRKWQCPLSPTADLPVG